MFTIQTTPNTAHLSRHSPKYSRITATSQPKMDNIFDPQSYVRPTI